MNNQRYYSDKQISDRKDDFFNRSKFAEEMVSALENSTTKDVKLLASAQKGHGGFAKDESKYRRKNQAN